MGQIVNKDLKNDEDLLRLMGIFIDLSFFTAYSRDKTTYLTVFTMDIESQLLYCCYVGSNEYEDPEKLSKQFFKKIKSFKQGLEKCLISLDFKYTGVIRSLMVKKNIIK